MKYLWYCISHDSKSEFILLGRDIKTVLWVVGHEWERQWLNFHFEYPREKEKMHMHLLLNCSSHSKALWILLPTTIKLDTCNKHRWPILFCNIIIFHNFHGFFYPEWLQYSTSFLVQSYYFIHSCTESLFYPLNCIALGATCEQRRIKIFFSVNVDCGKNYLCIIGGDLIRTCPFAYFITKFQG